MSAVVGIDLSSKAIDLVKLEEEGSRAEWVRVELWGKDAWERTLTLSEQFSDLPVGYWEDVYLVALEAPYGRGQSRTQAILNRVVGAIVASLPYDLRAAERCWLVAPHEWKSGLGLKSKPTPADVKRLSGLELPLGADYRMVKHVGDEQNARDAYCIALFARDENAKGIEKALTA